MPGADAGILGGAVDPALVAGKKLPEIVAFKIFNDSAAGLANDRLTFTGRTAAGTPDSKSSEGKPSEVNTDAVSRI